LEGNPAWEGTHPSGASRRLGGAAADIPAVVDDSLSSELPVEQQQHENRESEEKETRGGGHRHR